MLYPSLLFAIVFCFPFLAFLTLFCPFSLQLFQVHIDYITKSSQGASFSRCGCGERSSEWNWEELAAACYCRFPSPISWGIRLGFLLSSNILSAHFLKIADRGSFGNASTKTSTCLEDLYIDRCCSCWSCHYIRRLPCVQKIKAIELASKALRGPWAICCKECHTVKFAVYTISYTIELVCAFEMRPPWLRFCFHRMS